MCICIYIYIYLYTYLCSCVLYTLWSLVISSDLFLLEDEPQRWLLQLGKSRFPQKAGHLRIAHGGSPHGEAVQQLENAMENAPRLWSSKCSSTSMTCLGGRAMSSSNSQGQSRQVTHGHASPHEPRLGHGLHGKIRWFLSMGFRSDWTNSVDIPRFHEISPFFVFLTTWSPCEHPFSPLELQFWAVFFTWTTKKENTA